METTNQQTIKKGEKMKYQTHNEIDIGTGGTCYQGEIIVSYEEIISIFGKSADWYNNCDGEKIDAEWNIKFSDGKVATIYNWKNGINYLGKNGIPLKYITHWNIGGKTDDVVERINNIIKKGEK